MPSTSETAIAVVPYTSAWHDAVADLVLGIQQGEFGVDATYEGQPDLQDPGGFFRKGGGEFWVALADEKLVGCVGLLDFGGGRGAVRKMFVGAAWRGARYGVAGAMLQTLLRHAESVGMAEIWLDTHRSFHAAHRFYRKHGFEEVEAPDVPPDFPAMSMDERFFRLRLGAAA